MGPRPRRARAGLPIARLATGAGFVALVVLVVGAGCLSSVTPRTGEVAPRGRWTVEPSVTAVTVSVDEVVVEAPDGTRRTHREVGGALEEAGGGASPMFLLVEVDVRRALTDRLELGVQLDLLRIAGELRLGLLAERRGHLLSLAASASAGVQPFLGREGPWVRAGLDGSRRLGGRLLLVVNLHGSAGSESHAVPLPVPAPEPPGGVETVDEPGPHAQVTRREIRLLPMVSIGVPVESGTFFLGVAPHLILWSAAPSYAACEGCLDGTRIVSFEERLAASLVLGASYRHRW